MYSPLLRLLLFFVLALASAGLTFLMIRRGVIDHPDQRSSHATPTPTGGGVGIAVAGICGVLLFVNGPLLPRLAFGLGGVLMAGIGYWDDRHQYRPAVKFAVQYAAALIPLVLLLVPIYFSYYPLDALLTAAWVLLVTNAVNFMDGLNGLSAGVTAIAAIGFGLTDLTIGLIAGIFGFLPFNFPRARIFMGDVGSQFCGYALALLGLVELHGPHPLLVPFALAGFLFDVIVTLIRRQIMGDNITQAHRGHLYQIANRAGIPASAVTLIHWGFALWGIALALQPWHIWLVGALLLPQLIWAGLVVNRARRVPVGQW